MWPGVFAAAAPLLGKVFGNKDVGETVGSVAGIADKVTGIPSPVDRSGGEQGMDYSQFMDSAFPGTTPWERLGANTPMGNVESAEIGAKNQREMQARELQNRFEIAANTNRASVISALGQQSPMAAASGLSMLEGSSPSSYDTMTQIAGRKASSEIHKNIFEGRAARERSRLEEAEVPATIAEAKARAKEAEVSKKYAELRGYWDTVGSATSAVVPTGGLLGYLMKKPYKYTLDRPSRWRDRR